jgi:glycolate oxidase iron-sulfur subunit
VKYSRLVDIGRKVVEQRVRGRWASASAQGAGGGRDAQGGVWRGAAAGQIFRPLLSPALQDKLPRARTPGLAGARACAQDAGAGRLRSRRWRPTSTPPRARARCAGRAADGRAQAGCCGALRHHLNEQEAALDDMRRNIDAWWPYVQQGGRSHRHDGVRLRRDGQGIWPPAGARCSLCDKAQRISALTRDLSEIMPQFEPLALRSRPNGPRGLPPAMHAAARPADPRQGRSVLRAVGVDVVLCADSHLCCGSAGSYSLLQPELSLQLRDRKLASLADTGAQTIVSANVGCTAHLQSGTETPVMHWIELIDRALKQGQLRGVAISLAMQADDGRQTGSSLPHAAVSKLATHDSTSSGRHWPGDAVALYQVAAEAHQHGAVFDGLHAFRNHAQAERTRQPITALTRCRSSRSTSILRTKLWSIFSTSAGRRLR